MYKQHQKNPIGSVMCTCLTMQFFICLSEKSKGVEGKRMKGLRMRVWTPKIKYLKSKRSEKDRQKDSTLAFYYSSPIWLKLQGSGRAKWPLLEPSDGLYWNWILGSAPRRSLASPTRSRRPLQVGGPRHGQHFVQGTRHVRLFIKGGKMSDCPVQEGIRMGDWSCSK